MPEIELAELKSLLVENMADTKLIREEVVRIRAYMRWRTIISVIWILLIVLPLAASLFFIPDIIKGYSTSAGMIQGLGL